MQLTLPPLPPLHCINHFAFVFMCPLCLFVYVCVCLCVFWNFVCVCVFFLSSRVCVLNSRARVCVGSRVCRALKFRALTCFGMYVFVFGDFTPSSPLSAGQFSALDVGRP